MQGPGKPNRTFQTTFVLLYQEDNFKLKSPPKLQRLCLLKIHWELPMGAPLEKSKDFNLVFINAL